MIMLLMMDTLFPVATTADVVKVRIMLTDYKKALRRLRNAPAEQPLQIQALRNLERAVDAILDPEIRSIMQYRFIQGHPRKAAIIKFNLICARTLDRKIREGADSVANSLKTWGCI
ncbi:hypothetical protein EBB07_33915 [Paenibacillaceae bacterium]|nr:hypothetical protein EBB07_33915 [Paenibacillaceae bacterium]